MTDFYSQNRCVCSTRSHGPLLCAFCLSFHFNVAPVASFATVEEPSPRAGVQESQHKEKEDYSTEMRSHRSLIETPNRIFTCIDLMKKTLM